MEKATEFLKWLLLIFIGLWLVWFFTGGPQREISKKGIFIAPQISPTSMTRWVTYGDKTKNKPKTNLEKIKELSGISLYTNKITLLEGNATAENIDNEYIEIKASPQNTSEINITGWKIQSAVTGKSILIGKGTYLPYTSKINIQEPIYLYPGGTAIITTGRSPIGTSFRTNLCTGYLEQFQNFIPPLRKECPRPENEPDFITTGPNALNDQCYDYVTNIPRCQINTEKLPLNMQYECAVFISSKINYNSCVKNHKNQASFYTKNWRIFLNREKELWKSRRETIKLFDANNKLVSSIVY